MGCKILGIGAHLPGEPFTNHDIEKITNTNHEWIRTRTGILQRYFTKGTAAEMAFEASKLAIIDAGINKAEIDLIIVCSTTPDRAFPSTATTLHGMLGLSHVPSFDLNAVCSGFIYGMQVANALMHMHNYKKTLLIGSDKMSSVLSMEERSTAVLFGDGAGAVILEKNDDNLFDSMIGSNGKYSEILKTKSVNGVNSIFMQGKEVYKQAITVMTKMAEDILAKNSLTIDDIDFFVPHQANIRIIESIAEKLRIPSNKVVTTVTDHANTSAGTIPLALDDIKRKGMLKQGNIILMSALGAGITYGGLLIRY